MHSLPRNFAATCRIARRAFSIVELLVVIAIIALVVSIVIPAVGGARKNAKQADTIGLCNSLSQACSQFILDQRRVPGYFSAREMGDAENESRGFSAMQNVMLDLAGGVVANNATGNLATQVGPTAANTITVDINQIGAAASGNKAYFTPKSKNYRAQDGLDADVGKRTSSVNGHAKIPEVVDAEGAPILIWTIDENAKAPFPNTAAWVPLMARDNSSGNNAVARFYWASNAAFLSDGDGDFLGKRLIPQTDRNAGKGYSVISNALQAAKSANLAALLASPNSPAPYSATAAVADICPTAPIGSIVIHAAGQDGVFFNARDKGGAGNLDAGGFIRYGQNFKPKPSPILGGFDDVVIPGN